VAIRPFELDHFRPRDDTGIWTSLQNGSGAKEISPWPWVAYYCRCSRAIHCRIWDGQWRSSVPFLSHMPRKRTTCRPTSVISARMQQGPGSAQPGRGSDSPARLDLRGAARARRGHELTRICSRRHHAPTSHHRSSTARTAGAERNVPRRCSSGASESASWRIVARLSSRYRLAARS